MIRKILLDARIASGVNPGVQSMIEGFATGLKELQPENVKIYWLTSSDNNWLLKYTCPDQEVLIDKPQHLHELAADISIRIDDSRFDRNQPRMHVDERLPRQPKSLGLIKPDLVQFFSQDAFITDYKSIYHPHDLQHLYLTNNFSVEEIGWRNLSWPKYAGLASKVVVGSQHVAKDINQYWGIPTQRIEKIDLCSNLRSSDADREILTELSSISSFGVDYIIYPASYYLHKNHVTLLRAILLLKNNGLNVKVVLTGGNIIDKNHVNNTIHELGLQGQVLELGYVSKDYLTQLIMNSKCVVVPSFFESKSFPIVEGMSLGVPVIGSDIPGIREQAIDVNCLFNPGSESEIANSITRIIQLDKVDRDQMVKRNLSLSSGRNWTDVILDYARLWDQIVESEKS